MLLYIGYHSDDLAWGLAQATTYNQLVREWIGIIHETTREGLIDNHHGWPTRAVGWGEIAALLQRNLHHAKVFGCDHAKLCGHDGVGMIRKNHRHIELRNQRQNIGNSGFFYTGYSVDALQRVLIESSYLIGALILLTFQVNLKRQHVRGIKAGRHAAQIIEGAH